LEPACCEFSEPGDGLHKDNSLLSMKKPALSDSSSWRLCVLA
jgi:hypothetical protein